MSEEKKKSETNGSDVDKIVSGYLGMPDTGEKVGTLDMSLHDQIGRMQIPAKLARFKHRFVQPIDKNLRRAEAALEVINVWPYSNCKGFSQADDCDGFNVMLSLRTFETTTENGEEVVLEHSHRPHNTKTLDGQVVPDPRYPASTLILDSTEFIKRFEDDPDSLGMHQRAMAYLASKRSGGIGSTEYMVGR